MKNLTRARLWCILGLCPVDNNFRGVDFMSGPYWIDSDGYRNFGRRLRRRGLRVGFILWVAGTTLFWGVLQFFVRLS